MRFSIAAALMGVCLGTTALLLTSEAHSRSLGIQLIRNTDRAAAVTQKCQRGKDLKVTRNPRNYAKPHGVGYRKEAHRRWHVRRRTCQSYDPNPMGVPAWFWNVAMCIHAGESLDWYESYYEGSQYGGGLQYHPSTWIAAGGLRFAPTAYQASPIEQVRAAYDLTKGGQNGLLHVHWEAQNHCF